MRESDLRVIFAESLVGGITTDLLSLANSRVEGLGRSFGTGAGLGGHEGVAQLLGWPLA